MILSNRNKELIKCGLKVYYNEICNDLKHCESQLEFHKNLKSDSLEVLEQIQCQTNNVKRYKAEKKDVIELYKNLTGVDSVYFEDT